MRIINALLYQKGEKMDIYLQDIVAGYASFEVLSLSQLWVYWSTESSKMKQIHCYDCVSISTLS